MATLERITAVDLRDLSEAELTALRQEAIKLAIPLSEYLGRLVAETSERLVKHAEGRGIRFSKEGGR